MQLSSNKNGGLRAKWKCWTLLQVEMAAMAKRDMELLKNKLPVRDAAPLPAPLAWKNNIKRKAVREDGNALARRITEATEKRL